MIELFTTAFLTLAVIIDPPGCAPIFASLTAGTEAAHRRRMAIRSAVVAWSIFYHQIGASVLNRRTDIQLILDKIKLAGAGALKYFRWDAADKKYLPYASKLNEHSRKAPEKPKKADAPSTKDAAPAKAAAKKAAPAAKKSEKK